MRTPKPTDKRAVVEALLRGNLKPLEQYKTQCRSWAVVIANPQTPFGCEESPDDLMTEITVSPGLIEPIPAMTRREFTAFCEELSKSHNLILVT